MITKENINPAKLRAALAEPETCIDRPYAVLIKALISGRGCRLTAQEVRTLVWMDDAIDTTAMNIACDEQ